MTQIYETRPPKFEEIISIGTMTAVIRPSIVETEEGYECDEVYYDHHDPLSREKDYGGVVSAIVRHKYSSDQMEAIINNYLMDGTGTHKENFDEMQAWRALAKELAQELLPVLPDEEV